MISLLPVPSLVSFVLSVANLLSLGGSAQAAGELVKKMGGNLLGFVFLLELEFLHGRDKLPAPTHTLLSGQGTKA